MRIYQSFKEALPEIKRDLAEMGIKVHPKTYQDKNVERDLNFATLELQNYIYTVVQPNVADLEPTQPWADHEWNERRAGIGGCPINPGNAWEDRYDVWKEFLGEEEKFSYTYSERFAVNQQVERVIHRLKRDRDSRQIFVSVWDVLDTSNLGGVSRVPCTLGYLLQCRKDHLNITYLQRSADFATHLVNDIYLAKLLQNYVALETGLESGTYTHWIGSLHIFNKDAREVF